MVGPVVQVGGGGVFLVGGGGVSCGGFRKIGETKKIQSKS